MFELIDETIACDYFTMDELMDDIESDCIDYDPDYYSLRDDFTN
jgi:hypothetical protein